MSRNVDALKKLYVAYGGSLEDVADVQRNDEMIDALAELVGLEPVTVSTSGLKQEYWGTAVSDMQDSIVIGEGFISGTLKYVASGSLVETWNAHHFIALKFADPNGADTIKVGIFNPGALDEDMDAVIAVTDTSESLKVITVKDGVERIQTYDLSGLTLADE